MNRPSSDQNSTCHQRREIVPFTATMILDHDEDCLEANGNNAVDGKILQSPPKQQEDRMVFDSDPNDDINRHTEHTTITDDSTSSSVDDLSSSSDNDSDLISAMQVLTVEKYREKMNALLRSSDGGGRCMKDYAAEDRDDSTSSNGTSLFSHTDFSNCDGSTFTFPEDSVDMMHRTRATPQMKTQAAEAQRRYLLSDKYMNFQESSTSSAMSELTDHDIYDFSSSSSMLSSTHELTPDQYQKTMDRLFQGGRQGQKQQGIYGKYCIEDDEDEDDLFDEQQLNESAATGCTWPDSVRRMRAARGGNS